MSTPETHWLKVARTREHGRPRHRRVSEQRNHYLSMGRDYSSGEVQGQTTLKMVLTRVSVKIKAK